MIEHYYKMIKQGITEIKHMLDRVKIWPHKTKTENFVRMTKIEHLRTMGMTMG